ncbi:MAG TPA: hypothetical protein VNE67_09195 [Acetobacteraceae bacterium]|nr:hypothetical protein [Acetobacteraceae bacterium]
MSAVVPSPEPAWGSAASVRAEMALSAPQGGGPRADHRRRVHQVLDGFRKNWNGVSPPPRPALPAVHTGPEQKS